MNPADTHLFRVFRCPAMRRGFRSGGEPGPEPPVVIEPSAVSVHRVAAAGRRKHLLRETDGSEVNYLAH